VVLLVFPPVGTLSFLPLEPFWLKDFFVSFEQITVALTFLPFGTMIYNVNSKEYQAFLSQKGSSGKKDKVPTGGNTSNTTDRGMSHPAPVGC
jgi:hypothetical protein